MRKDAIESKVSLIQEEISFFIDRYYFVGSIAHNKYLVNKHFVDNYLNYNRVHIESQTVKEISSYMINEIVFHYAPQQM